VKDPRRHVRLNVTPACAAIRDGLTCKFCAIRGSIMRIDNPNGSLGSYPYRVQFETVRDMENARRHNWSPGYYDSAEGTWGRRPGELVDVPLADGEPGPEQREESDPDPIDVKPSGRETADVY
jgi:hypothetical protein